MRRPAPELALVLGALAAACSTGTPCVSRNSGTVPPTPPDPPLSCPVELPADTLGDARAQCTFSTGARVTDTLGIPSATALSLPIRHVVLLMKENRSFDHLLGQLHAQGQPGVEAVPASFINRDTDNAKVAPFRPGTTCLPIDPGHQWDAIHAAVDNGAMDGFVKVAASATGTDGHFVMSTYARFELPFYYWLASRWALNDRHFASVRSGTSPNREYVLLGTSAGIKSTGDGKPDPATPSILKALEAAGYTWGVYTDSPPFNDALAMTHDDPNTYCFDDLLKRLDSGTLPNVAFVDGRDAIDDDHPEADLQAGEAWMRRIYRHAVKSPQWPRLALLWTYDESGGFADHVSPPGPVCAPSASPADAPFTELGIRVPFVAISPYARSGYVSHVVQEHTAITRFIETLFDLPALTARDANSSALLDLFDFSCPPPMLHPPSPPEEGVGGCERTGRIAFDFDNGM